MDVLEGLNPAQRKAAGHGHSPLLIIAGAGTGKTKTLVHRTAHLIQNGISPNRILLLTYTRRAAQMMTERMRKLFDKSVDLSGLWSGTFHAVSVRLLRTYHQAIGLPPYFSVHDRSDSEELLETLMKRINVKGLPKKGTALSIHSYQVNSQWPLKKVIVEQYPEFLSHHDTLSSLYREYHRHKRQLGIADFDDLLLLMRDMVHHPELGEQIRNRFQAVLVDEYQDTNVLQSQILNGLTREGQGLTVVGDDAQSIYSFRAATVRNILDFPLQYPQTEVVKLEQNYRSTAPILNVSNQLMEDAQERFTKELWCDRTEGAMPQLVECSSDDDLADIVVRRILRHKTEGIPIAQQAVLFRAAHHSLALETELMRNKINFVKYGGLKFVESAHVKDLLAFLRLAENNKDTVSAIRILLLLPGIGPRKASQLLEMLEVSSSGLEIWQQFKPPAQSGLLWKKMLKLLTNLSQGKPTSLVDQLIATLQFYQPLLEERYDNATQRMTDLKQLIAMADRFESRQQMLVDLSLDPPSSTADLPDEEAVAKVSIDRAASDSDDSSDSDNSDDSDDSTGDAGSDSPLAGDRAEPIRHVAKKASGKPTKKRTDDPNEPPRHLARNPKSRRWYSVRSIRRKDSNGKSFTCWVRWKATYRCQELPPPMKAWRKNAGCCMWLSHARRITCM